MNVFTAQVRAANRSRDHGSALLAVYWTLAVLGLTVFGISHFVLDSLEAVNHRRDDFDARLLAERAIAIAAHPLIQRDDPLLQGDVGEGRAYKATIISEGALLNLNAVVLREQNDVLERLFASWGMEFTAVANLISSLQDWVDTDDLVRPGGAEDRVYEEAGIPGRPFNRPFRSLEEARLVAGMDQLAELRPDWADSFTLWSGGPLDVSEAEAPLIVAATGAPETLAVDLVFTRRGLDGIDGTEDDVPLNSLDSVMAMLQVPEEMALAMAQRITIDERTTRIVGEGTAHGITLRQILVLRNRESRPSLLHFAETRVRNPSLEEGL